MNYLYKFITKRKIRPVFAVVLMAVAMAVGAHSVPVALADQSRQAPVEVDIDLNEWNLIPSDFDFQAGDQVRFNITNTGQFTHALEVSNPAIHLHSSNIAANETTTLDITFEYGGEYKILCPIPGHAALGMEGSLNVEGGDPAPEGDFIGIPLMRINPRSGTVVSGTSQEVSAIIHDFTLDADSTGDSENVGGEGHWDLFLDDELVESVAEPTYMLEDLAPGEHTIRVELKNNDGTPLDPPVSASSSIQVAQQVDIALNEWSLAPPDWNFQAGDLVTFNITNAGQFSHALEVSNPAIHLHSDTIAAAETTALTVNLENGGEYTILCPIPGHAELGMVGTLTVDGGEPAPEGDFIGIPLMRLNPRSGTEVEGTSQEVQVVLHDFTLDADAIGDSENVGGVGHWALFLDDELVDSIGEPVFMLENLTPGEHTIRAELRNNDGTPVEPAVSASSTITVPGEEEAPVAPSVGDSLVPTAANFALGAGAVLLTLGVVTLIMRRRRRV
jgi:uncharacterized cupredoxin-like copper-binding protein